MTFAAIKIILDFLLLVIDFKFQTGYTVLQRQDMEQFKFIDINRLTNEVLSEASLVMDLSS